MFVDKYTGRFTTEGHEIHSKVSCWAVGVWLIWVGVVWIHLASDRYKRWALMNMVGMLRAP